jgi:hypothetical protein
MPPMQYFFLLGGFVGFLIPCGVGLYLGHDPVHMLFNSGVGCLVGAYVMRTFWRVMARCVRNSMVEKSRLESASTPAR